MTVAFLGTGPPEGDTGCYTAQRELTLQLRSLEGPFTYSSKGRAQLLLAPGGHRTKSRIANTLPQGAQRSPGQMENRAWDHTQKALARRRYPVGAMRKRSAHGKAGDKEDDSDQRYLNMMPKLLWPLFIRCSKG